MSKFAWAGGKGGVALGGAVAGLLVLAGLYATRLLENEPDAPPPKAVDVTPEAPEPPGGPFPEAGAVAEAQGRASGDAALSAADVQDLAPEPGTPAQPDEVAPATEAGGSKLETAAVPAPPTGASQTAGAVPEAQPSGTLPNGNERQAEGGDALETRAEAGADDASAGDPGAEQGTDDRETHAVSAMEGGAPVGDPLPDPAAAETSGPASPGIPDQPASQEASASGASANSPGTGGAPAGTIDATARAMVALGDDDASPDAFADDAPATPTPPSFDIVRVTPDGSALVAGRADPGAEISLKLDGAFAGTANADASGSFVAFLSVPRGSGPRVLSMSSAIAGVSTPAESEVILAPSPRSGGAVASAAPHTARATQEGPADYDGGEADDTAAPDLPRPDAATAAGTAPPPAEGEVPAAPAGQAEPDSERMAVLLSGPEGIEMLQPAAPPTAPVPEAQDFVSIDTISYDAAGEVALSGRSDTGSGPGAVRIYLDNRPLMTAAISPTGRWRADLPGVAAGTYTLRVDRLNEAGAVTARAESPFLRERREALVAASPRSRDARVEAVTVQPGNTLWAIAREQYGEGILYVRVFEANDDQIRDPDLIYPGQIFSIPE